MPSPEDRPSLTGKQGENEVEGKKDGHAYCTQEEREDDSLCQDRGRTSPEVTDLTGDADHHVAEQHPREGHTRNGGRQRESERGRRQRRAETAEHNRERAGARVGSPQTTQPARRLRHLIPLTA